MAHKKVTSKPMAAKASKALKSVATSKITKSLAGSVLSQSKGKHKGSKKH